MERSSNVQGLIEIRASIIGAFALPLPTSLYGVGRGRKSEGDGAGNKAFYFHIG